MSNRRANFTKEWMSLRGSLPLVPHLPCALPCVWDRLWAGRALPSLVPVPPCSSQRLWPRPRRTDSPCFSPCSHPFPSRLPPFSLVKRQRLWVTHCVSFDFSHLNLRLFSLTKCKCVCFEHYMLWNKILRTHIYFWMYMFVISSCKWVLKCEGTLRLRWQSPQQHEGDVLFPRWSDLKREIKRSRWLYSSDKQFDSEHPWWYLLSAWYMEGVQ